MNGESFGGGVFARVERNLIGEMIADFFLARYEDGVLAKNSFKLVSAFDLELSMFCNFCVHVWQRKRVLLGVILMLYIINIKKIGW